MLDGARSAPWSSPHERDVWSRATLEAVPATAPSDAHREGDDLDLIVEWADGASTALDVATGGGHVARRLREAGLEVVSVRPGAGDAART